MHPKPGEAPRPHGQRVYLDLTHLGRHVTGIERVTIEQFEKVAFAGADVRHVRARGILSMILRQQLLIPLLALLHRRAMFVFPGFPPSPLMRLARGRAVMYVHDLFLIRRRQDLGLKARLYMAWPFGFAVRGLRYFLVNSAKTRAELADVATSDARIDLYRPAVANVFGLAPTARDDRPADGALRIIALGTVEPRKNYTAAARIVSALRRKGFPEARLEIVGREGWGNETDALKSDPNVALRGYLSAADAKAAIESADLYLCTSHDEGLGLPLLEVQYGGLAVVAPDAAVFREVLGESGTFIDAADTDSAADTIARLVATPGWRTTARTKALANVARWNESARRDSDRVTGLFAAPLAALWPAGAVGLERR